MKNVFHVSYIGKKCFSDHGHDSTVVILQLVAVSNRLIFGLIVAHILVSAVLSAVHAHRRKSTFSIWKLIYERGT